MSQTTKPGKTSRRPIASHGQLRSPNLFAQLLKGLAVVLAVVLVSGAGVAAYAVTDLTATLQTRSVKLEGEAPVPAQPPGIAAYQGDVNLLLIGTDQCEPAYDAMFGNRCKGKDSGTENNDVDMLLHISSNPRRVTVISFPRDMMLPVPSCTNKNGGKTSPASKLMLNTTYEIGGLGCVAKTITQLTGIEIPFAAKITWGGVIQITNAIGGVDVCVSGHLKDRLTGLDMTAGMHNIQGLQALQFLRTRHGVGDGSDLGRISNQQQYMSRLVKKIMGEGVLSDPAMLLKLANTAVNNITPSDTLANPITLAQIALAMKSVPFDQFVFVQYPTGYDPTNPNRVIPNKAAATALLTALSENKQLQLTGNNGVGSVQETPAPGTSTAPVTPTTAPTPGATAGAGSTATPAPVATLPSTVTGTTAAEDTCSKGQVYNGNG
ncbi:LCP family protein [Microbacterium sp. ASV49]|uniref:LCP family protein n=1 Tax=Microbacterium candidum TaxID=3041922 RepID=A0ABT7MVV1_9MICO|nr:LCP family protein [Microbacterium sp. ASV49]MDL9978579.1 LCP family protein [Microbacterium sp. ASV49]